MTAVPILAELKSLGVAVVTRGENLVITPASRVPEDLKAHLRDHKQEVLALLRTDAALLARVEQMFDGARVEIMSREDGEILWQERLRHENPAARYLRPWPDALVGLGPRVVGPFDQCADCGTRTWARFGDMPLCVPCANRRAAETLNRRVVDEAPDRRDQDEEPAPAVPSTSPSGRVTPDVADTLRRRDGLVKRHPALFSSLTDEWETPEDLYRGLDEEFRFTVDVCATSQNAKAPAFGRSMKTGSPRTGRASGAG